MKIKYKFELTVETNLPSGTELTSKDVEKVLLLELEAVPHGGVFSGIQLRYIPPVGFLNCHEGPVIEPTDYSYVIVGSKQFRVTKQYIKIALDGSYVMQSDFSDAPHAEWELCEEVTHDVS